MGMKYRVIFNYHGKEITDPLLKAAVEEAYIAERNQACDLLNPNYANWNEEWEKIIGVYRSMDNDEEYNQFIETKQKPILDKVNKMYGFPEGFGLCHNKKEPCEIAFSYGDGWIDITLEPIDE